MHTRFILQITALAQLRPKRALDERLRVERIFEPDVALNRWFYEAVGRAYWAERRDWDDARWLALIGAPTYHTFVAYVGDARVGYFEFEQQDSLAVQIVCLGLLPEYIGHGLGGPLVTAAVEEAFSLGASRVWLDTATDDHPAALPSYLARGFEIVREEPLLDPMPLAPGAQSATENTEDTEAGD